MREREMRVSQRDLPRLYLVRYQELKDGISSSRSTTIYGSRLARVGRALLSTDQQNFSVVEAEPGAGLVV